LRLGRCISSPPIRAVRASLQASRAAGAPCAVVCGCAAGGVWKCERGGWGADASMGDYWRMSYRFGYVFVYLCDDFLSI
jgi:hypothetical protein